MQRHSFLTLTIDGGERSWSTWRSDCFTPLEEDHRIQLLERWVGYKASLDILEQKQNIYKQLQGVRPQYLINTEIRWYMGLPEYTFMMVEPDDGLEIKAKTCSD